MKKEKRRQRRKQSRRYKKYRICALVLAVLALAAAAFLMQRCGSEERDEREEELTGEETPVTSYDSYGVFLGVDEQSFRISGFDGYDLVVIDVQELRPEQIAQLHSSGHTVYAYLNVGSIEKSRDYYRDYKDIVLDRYENWPDERWVDVTQKKWQKFAAESLPEMIRQKDPSIDGLFLDNLDVYSHMIEKYGKRYDEEEIFSALAEILEVYREEGLPVLVNGADAFVSLLIEEGRDDLIEGVNQETVFSRILDYDRDRFGLQEEDERKRYEKYLRKCHGTGLEVFLLEYTQDEDVREDIAKYCDSNDFRYYISEHVNLGFADEDD